MPAGRCAGIGPWCNTSARTMRRPRARPATCAWAIRRRCPTPWWGPRRSCRAWDGVDRTLFEAMRRLRVELAGERQVPPYVIFSDATLRELARVRPSTPERMRLVSGVGDAKLRDFGGRFLKVIAEHCRHQGQAQ